MILKGHLCIFVLFILLAGVNCNRKVSAVLNPGCNVVNCKNIILFHVKAEGANDTLHHLWDFTGKPSFLLALTDKNATVNISWQGFAFGKKEAININPTPKYTYGTVIDNLIEFNDEQNTGILNVTNNNSSYVTLLDTKNFDWKVTNTTNSTGDATLTIESTVFYDEKTKLKKNGTVRIVMSAFGGKDHAEALPHLLHSGNASQMDLTLDNLSTQYKRSRFGVSLVTASSDNPDSNDTVVIKARKTMDDEHAPGVFTIIEMVTPAVQSGGCGGYLQWRPVVYTSATRDMTSNTESMQYSVMAVAEPLVTLNNTLLLCTLGNKLDSMQVVATNITFGNSEDGSYVKKRYAAWTMLVGYGHPPEEQFSMLVTLVLLIGLGLPAVVILTVTICVVLRRLQRNKDDLFLSR